MAPAEFWSGRWLRKFYRLPLAGVANIISLGAEDILGTRSTADKFWSCATIIDGSVNLFVSSSSSLGGASC